MDNIAIVNTPSSISANPNPAYGECLPKMAATESFAFQSQNAAWDISAGLMTAMVAIPLSLSIGIVLSVKMGFVILACAYLIGWALSHSQYKLVNEHAAAHELPGAQAIR